jgi:hypothetical protein
MNLHARPHPAALMAMVLLPALAGCGDLPMPFKDRPGATALRLAAPPPTRLAVPAPSDALLARDGAALLARDMAGQLDDQDVPAEAITPERGDWRLVLTASLAGDQVIPTYTVLTPRGTVRGRTSGKPVAASAWANADPATLQQVAQAAAPDIAAMLTGIQAAIRQADPNSLMHRPARIYFTGVTGAPGDGNQALATAIRAQLRGLGDVVSDQPQNADFTLTGVVGVAPPKDGQQAVELDWHVLDGNGKVAGNVSQLNAVPAHTLDYAWGEIAQAAGVEAASGVHQVITNNSGRNDKPLPPPPGS